MANLKEVRNRIKSVISTQQITTAMKLVSASKFKKAQDAIVRMRPYSTKLNEILDDLTDGLETVGDNVYSKVRKDYKILLIVVTSNKGLCGSFNANVLKQTVLLVNTKYAEQYKKGNVFLMCIGRKAAEYFGKRKYNVIESNTKIFDHVNFANVSVIAERVMKDFALEKYDRVDFIYNQFKNAAVQFVRIEEYLPIAHDSSKKKNKKHIDYIFEPSKQKILDEIMPKLLKILFYRYILDSNASEHGARMTAMNKATDNANEILKDLKITYNKARQAAITNEIVEIVSGANALKG